jgi:hypothetical protein
MIGDKYSGCARIEANPMIDDDDLQGLLFMCVQRNGIARILYTLGRVLADVPLCEPGLHPHNGEFLRLAKDSNLFPVRFWPMILTRSFTYYKIIYVIKLLYYPTSEYPRMKG